MRSALQTFLLLVASGVVVAFTVSFGLGLRRPAFSTETRAANSAEDVPGVFSGRRVEVLNSAGRRGSARNATELLRGAGYDVVYFGNTQTPSSDSSVVLDRVGKPELARAVAAALGISRTETRRDATRFVEVTVIIGADWQPPR